MKKYEAYFYSDVLALRAKTYKILAKRYNFITFEFSDNTIDLFSENKEPRVVKFAFFKDDIGTNFQEIIDKIYSNYDKLLKRGYGSYISVEIKLFR